MKLILEMAMLLVILGCSTLTMSTNTGTLIVLNKTDNTASIINLATGKTVATVPTGPGPHEGEVTSDGRFAIVADYGTGPGPGNTLTIINLATNKVDRTIDLSPYQRPHGLALMPDGEHLLVTAEAQQALIMVNITTGEVVKAITTDQQTSHMVAVTPDGQRAFVANIGSGSVTVIDLEKGQRIANIPTGAGAEGIAIAPDGKEVWVTNRAANTITILDAETLDVLATLACEAFPIRIKFTIDGKHALVSNAESGAVAIFDVAKRVEAHRISLDVSPVEDRSDRLFSETFGESPVPIGIFVHPNGKVAYVAATNADRVMVISLESWQVIDQLPTGKQPDGLAFSGR